MSVISERTLYLSSEDLSSFGDSRIININVPTQLTNYKNTNKLKMRTHTGESPTIIDDFLLACDYTVHWPSSLMIAIRWVTTEYCL